MKRRVVWKKFIDVSEVMMDTSRTRETSINFYQTTQRNIPETVIFILAAVRT
jgi:hypothetical protein